MIGPNEGVVVEITESRDNDFARRLVQGFVKVSACQAIDLMCRRVVPVELAAQASPRIFCHDMRLAIRQQNVVLSTLCCDRGIANVNMFQS